MRPLDGVRVLEVGQYISAPYCAMLLADQGANVVKIERPGGGDPRRRYDPLIERDGDSTSGGFLSYNRNKRSVTLNLRDSRGQDIFRALAGVSDVIVENLRPGVMEAANLAPTALCTQNPRLIYAAISGYGRDPGREGPFSHRPAFDAAIQATAGIMSVTGQADGPPSLTVIGFADIYTAVSASLAISMALYARERTGRGCFIDQAMYDTVASLMERALMIYDFTGEVMSRGVDRFAPVGTLPASDGYVAVIIPTDEMWRRFCAAVQRPDLLDRPELSTVLQRSARFLDIVVPEVQDWTRTMTRSALVDKMAAAGLPAGEVQTVPELYHSQQAAARGLLMDLNDPAAGPRKVMKTPVSIPGFDPMPARPAPPLGAHTEEVLTRWLDVDSGQLAQWAAERVV
jgi:crotonobetainyl-CoA:carnitine CoA-transferase CaiB-like acyl-CoA transferase